MKRVVGLLGFLLAAWFGARAVLAALASDEDLVRELLQQEREAFDAGSTTTTMHRFAEDYRDASGITVTQLHSAVLWAMQNRRGPDGTFRYSVQLDAEQVPVAVEGDAATASFDLALLDETTPSLPTWTVRVDAEFARREGRWWLVRSRHAMVSGRRPF